MNVLAASLEPRPTPRPGAAADVLIDRAKSFLAAISAGAPADIVAGFLAPRFRRDNLPNSLLPERAAREFLALQTRHAGGRKVVATHDFDVTNAVALGDCVAVETIWTGSFAVDLGPLQHVELARGRFAQVFEFEGGRIARLRSHLCSDPP